LQASRGLSLPGGSKGFGLAVADRIYPVYSLGLVIITIILILLTTTIVSYMPSRKIAKMKPTDALRGKIQ
jgi:ABC-type antimicrobial peptide transport system permease subunit